MGFKDGQQKRDFKRQKYGGGGGGRGGGGRGRGGGGRGGGMASGGGRGGAFPGGSRDGGIWKSKLVCFGCRGTGHSLRDCRVMKGGANGGVRGKKTCFNCGGDDHAARECKAPNSNFKYAVCFTCGETGHLVRDCPSNKQGIYINGGACKICKGTDHLAMHCPSKDKCLRCGEKGHVSSACPKENSGKYVPPKRVRAGRGAAPGETVPPRGGGDDLEDDFEEELGKAVKSETAKERNSFETESDGGDDEGAPAASDLEWEKGEDGAVLRDARGNLDLSLKKKKKRKSGDGSGGGLESGKKTKTKKAHKVVEF